MAKNGRLTTGITDLDDILGGGLIPGRKVIVYGATGVGKSILGVTLAYAGIEREGHPGMIVDISEGADSQNQIGYARQMFGWQLEDWNNITRERSGAQEEGIRLTLHELSRFAYKGWSLDAITTPPQGSTNNFLRCHLPKTQRLIIDGSEPYETAKGAKVLDDLRAMFTRYRLEFGCIAIYKHPINSLFTIDNEVFWNSVVSQEDVNRYVTEGVQDGSYTYSISSDMDLFKLIRSEGEKIAYGFSARHVSEEENDLFRNLQTTHPKLYSRILEKWNREVTDPDLLQPRGPLPVNMVKIFLNTDEDIIVFLQTTLDRSIFDLVNRPIEVGSLDSEVNTVIVMGYFPATQENPRPGRGLAVLKHRGSHYEQGIFEYQITDKGIQISR